MASAWHHCITMFLFLLIAGLCDATDYNILDLEMARKHELWMAEHGRVYKDEAEKARRFEIFKENVKYIEDFNNAGEHNYTLGVNHFADLTTEEFMDTYTGGFLETEFEESLRSIKYETMEPLNLSAVPSSVDWRTEGAVSPVVSQGSCGSCWAFTAVTTVESLNKIKKGVLHILSPQQLVDCDSSNLGCKGGRMANAYSYIIRNGGLTSAKNYPYKEAKGSCDSHKEKEIVATIEGFGKVNRYSKSALEAAVARQPIAVAVKVSNEWRFYKSGVYDGPCGSVPNHAITAVGYGETADSTEYWIVRNQWGTWWGEDGYIRLKRDVLSFEGTCGIAIAPIYPTL